jgi:hypothetical protein
MPTRGLAAERIVAATADVL